MNKNSTVIILMMLALCLLSCKNNRSEDHLDTSVQVHQKNETTEHWSYEGETSPEHWAEIEKNSDCDGEKQSPVNIIDVETKFAQADSLNLNIDYSAETIIHDVMNNGHSIQFDFELGDSILYKK